MQRNCISPGRCAPLTYYEDVLEASRNTLMACNAREICNFFAHLCVVVYKKICHTIVCTQQCKCVHKWEPA